LRAQFLKNCVFDLCSGISLRSETRIARQTTKQQKKVLHRQEVRRNIFIKEKKHEERRHEERKRFEEKKKI